jgi:hypothetical protein
MKITGTFIDEISHDIPHQNWGKKEWKRDFENMKSIGIDTVILIRCGYKKWLTYPSSSLIAKEHCHTPTEDLISLFLDLSEQFGMDFFIGLYDSGKYWWEEGNFAKEIEINKYVCDEIWKKYGHRKSFKGWYLSQEVSRKTNGIISLYKELGMHCKALHPELKTIISPYIDGTKAILSNQASLSKSEKISLAQHEKEWSEIFDQIAGNVDIVAFQDGHVDYDTLPEYLSINKSLADQFGIQSWTNAESFDRDMPIKFLPIKWEKLLLKLEAAKKAAIEKAITFEFSHFMSPQSAYIQAHHLYNRYMEHFKL